MENIAIIVAGGSGSRFGGPVPKQFLPLHGEPVLMRTLERFADAVDARLIVVLPQEHIATWQALCQQHRFAVAHDVVAGGASRRESVLNGLRAIETASAEAVVAIHDGVRPLVSTRLITEAYDVARRMGAVVPVVPVTDSMRCLDDQGGSRPVDRSTLRAVQTPQVFTLGILRQAYAMPDDGQATDDAMVVERLGRTVTLIAGDPDNIKITTTKDLHLAHLLMNL